MIVAAHENAGDLAMIFCVCYCCTFCQRNRFLLLCDSDGFAERGLNLGLLSTHSREKCTAQPVQFGRPITVLKSFD